MWYFAWVLGMPLACCLAILNAMWLELRFDDERMEHNDGNNSS
ncbi:MAG: cytochrome bd-I oxidase subunit CydX [Roseibium sp.]